MNLTRNFFHVLQKMKTILLEVHDLVSEAVKANRQITPAGEWLLDNFYLIEEQIRTGRRHLPKGYSKELPRSAKWSICRTSPCL